MIPSASIQTNVDDLVLLLNFSRGHALCDCFALQKQGHLGA
jgi:hypothetical protein